MNKSISWFRNGLYCF